MINRNKSELNRIRRYRDPDDITETEIPRGYVKWFGLWLKERYVYSIGFGLCFTMVALVVARAQFADGIDWLPTGQLWFELTFLGLITSMSFTSLSMFYCGTMTLKRQIREINARMARSDQATPEEVEELLRQTDKRINRQALWRAIICAVVIIILYPLLGTTLVFPWGGVLAFFGTMIALMVLVGAALYFQPQITEQLQRWRQR